MLKQFKYIFCLVILACCFGQLRGQTFDDWEGRAGIAIEHEFNNGVKARLRYRHSLDDHLAHYKNSDFDVKIEYKVNLNSWLEPAIDYRYKFNGEDSYHDIRYTAKFNAELGKDFVLEYAPKFQQILAAGKAPEFNIRNEIEFIYTVNRNWSISVFSENYQNVNEGIQFDAQKNGLGTEYEINKKNELEFKFDIKNKSSHTDIARLTFIYTYIIE